jgi:hypothetical protein
VFIACFVDLIFLLFPQTICSMNLLFLSRPFNKKKSLVYNFCNLLLHLEHTIFDIVRKDMFFILRFIISNISRILF